MNVFDAIQSRRSVRKFLPEPIPEEVIQRLLEAMRLAPSGKNAQPWKFIVVRDAETRKRIAAVCKFYSGSGREVNQDWIADAPVIFVVCGDPHTAFVKIIEPGKVTITSWENLEERQRLGEVEWESGLLVDLTIPMDHLSLAAVAEGLSGCWVAGLDEDALKGILGIPAGWRAPAVMPIGYPLENPEPRRRKPLEEIACMEKFKA
jgi:nitroreductase